ncbi:MAG: N-glycosylase DNA lyase [Lasallia pustulata]|uniref:DNA-(apurinic or apyrimidinic site) lyase n=1 Tax=Lasallia pustulata TaxID=136370 RepID=A0A5M8Q391_9LECA|nr:MAG: N-glycosylase DNA lyase [Lasallia pustulata]
MATGRVMNWRKLPVSLSELCIDTTLRCGQSFRWRKSGNDEWSCALHGRLLSLRQDPSHLHYRSIFPGSIDAPPTPPASAPPSIVEPPADDDDTEAFLQHYLNLGPNLTELYEQWSSADLNFKKKAPRFTGVRILKQDAWEALVGFICSSNNNIARISQMMEKLCVHYGPLIGHLDSQPYYDMPSPTSLTHPKVEAHLRELGFGYRAKYLHQTAVMITQERDHGWLDDLRNPESPILGHKVASAGDMLPGGREGYRNAHEKLLELQGVGPKVADCVCLMGLGWGEAVPVDTHVWQIAQRDYKFGKGKHRSLTKATYDAIGDHFRSLWGKEAGWAHSVLFTADLRAFSEKLSAKVEVKQEFFKAEEDARSTLEMTSEVTVVTEERIKREFEEEEKTTINIEDVIVRKVKRRRGV